MPHDQKEAPLPRQEAAPPLVQKAAPPLMQKAAPPPVQETAPPPVQKAAPPPVQKTAPPRQLKAAPLPAPFTLGGRPSRNLPRVDYKKLNSRGFAKYALLPPQPVPTLYSQAITSPKAKKWQKVMQIEFDSLTKNHTWDLVNPPPNQNVLSGKQVFKLKNIPNGSIKYKARWVVRRFE